MDSEAEGFAGFGPESINTYASHVGEEELSEEAAQLLSNDINYKMRHVLQNCLTKCKKGGRQVITSLDIDEAFEDLAIDKVYGAPSSPTWISGRDEGGVFHFLNDQKVDLVEIAEEELNLEQRGGAIIAQEWLDSDDNDNDETQNDVLAGYFSVVCKTVINNDEEIRQEALLDLSTNPSIGPIAHRFYNFSFFMLLKDDGSIDLPMRILSLLEVLENSPVPSLTASAKQLRMTVKLLLQRILMMPSEECVLKYTCYILSLFCLRPSMKAFVLRLIEERLSKLLPEVVYPLLNIMYYLGIDAVKQVFIPNIVVFLEAALEAPDVKTTDILVSIYGLICKADLNTGFVSEAFRLTFEVCDRALSFCYKQKIGKIEHRVPEIDEDDVVHVQLARTKRQMFYENSKGERKSVTVGKTWVKLPRKITRCSTHILFITL